MLGLAKETTVVSSQSNPGIFIYMYFKTALEKYENGLICIFVASILKPECKLGIAGPCESSKAVQTLQKHIPELLTVYFANLPKSPLLVSTFQELALRVMSLYVTIAGISIYFLLFPCI